MANKKISELTAGTIPLAGDEQIPVVQGGATVRVPASALQGEQGPPGADGTSVALKGSVATVGDLPTGAAEGDLYVVLADGDGYVWNGTTWDNVGPIRGPEGAQGPQGETGPAGMTSWSGITDKPTTLSGFGITDAVSDAELADGLAGKVDKVTGKGLSTEDYTSGEKTKLAGIATGATANSADATLLNRANHTGSQAISTVTGLQTALDGKIGSTEKGATNGVASLGSDSKILAAQLPALAITDVFPVASEAAMLALTAERGDVAVRSDINKSFALSTDDPTTLANWIELKTPTDAVLSVAGRTGAITLGISDIGSLQTALDDKFDKAGGETSGDITVNHGTDSRVLLKVSGTTQAQLQAVASAIRLSSNNAIPLVFATNGVDRVTTDSNGNITFGSTSASANYTFKGTNTGDLVVMESTDTGASAAPDLVLYRNSSSPAASDQLGVIVWRGKDSGAADQQYARIGSTITDPTAASEDADLWFEGVTAGTAVERLRLASDGATFSIPLLSPTLVTPALGTPASGNLSNATADGTNPVGFRNIPQNSQSAAYTCVIADSGKHIFHPSADTTARTFTIPANSSVAYPIGTAITFVNQNGAGVVTIAITTDTMRLAGAGTTGSRTLAANGIATAIKVASTEWLINGTGLT